MMSDVEIVEETDDYNDDGSSSSSITTRSLAYHPPPLPKPPAGFVVDDTGRVLMASNKRLVTIVSFSFLEALDSYFNLLDPSFGC